MNDWLDYLCETLNKRHTAYIGDHLLENVLSFFSLPPQNNVLIQPINSCGKYIFVQTDNKNYKLNLPKKKLPIFIPYIRNFSN